MFIQSSQRSSDGGVKVVLDCIVSPPLELRCNLFPFVAETGVCLEKGAFLRSCPFLFGDVGVELIVPSGCRRSYLSLICLEVL